MSEDPNLTADEVAAELRCGAWAARRLMVAGEIEAAKIAGRWIARRSAVAAYQERLTAGAQPQQRRRRRRAS